MPDEAIVPATKTARRFKPEEKANWVAEHHRSGESIREFALKHGLGPSNLHRWVQGKGLGRKGRKPASLFAEIKLPQSLAPAGGSPLWAAELVRPNGSVLRLAHDAPPGLLEYLMKIC